jgi:long-subunit acyl-CoA synthetase (AMP-forming)
VPLPYFFSKSQIDHVLQSADVDTVINLTDYDDMPDRAVTTIDIQSVQNTRQSQEFEYRGGAERVIYTSGSSGNPKGVVIGDRQIEASLTGLSAAIAPTSKDKHLSVLPFSQLLEQICGIFLPILAGGKTVIVPEAANNLFGGPIGPLTEAFEREQPTTSLLAPRLLSNWISSLNVQSHRPPECLRFVAVGGAPSAPALIEDAENLGIPIYEGYGLSECCSVVALNRPDENTPGTVGQVLDGITAVIVNREIVISGPTVMEGYLGSEEASYSLAHR